MNVTAILHAQQLGVMLQNLSRAKQELQAHVEQDFQAIKTEFEQTVAHFESEVARGKAALSAFDTRIVSYIEQGLHPVQAVNAVANEDAAKAAAAAKETPSGKPS